VFVLVPVTGCKSSPVLLSRYEDTSSCSKRLSPLLPFLQPNKPKRNRTAPLRALSVCLSPTFVWTQFRRLSSAALSTCIARCCGRPFSATYLPATPSACPLGANSIRRPGFPPQSNHPIKALLPQITPLHFRDIAPDNPFQVPLDCRPRCSISQDELVRNAQLSSQTSACSALRSHRYPFIQT
jgi:hypothetical protein